MARPREFDEAAVIDRARDEFWAGGVAATSVSDLSAATGLSVGSIYKAFGSKAGLCHRTLDDYLDRGYDHVAAVLSSHATPLEGLHAWLDGVAHRAADPGPTRGCYAVVCATELADRDPAVRDRLRRHDQRLRRLVADAVAAAVAAGELDADPPAAARLLCITVNGVQVEARKGIELDDARDTLHLALAALR